MFKKFIAITIASAGFAAAPAYAAETLNGACMNYLTLNAGSTLVSCYGDYSNNKLNDANNATINAALGQLNYTGSAIVYGSLASSSKLESLSAATVDFPGLLNGTVFVGIHVGGSGGGVTTFYRINAVNLDSFTFNNGPASNAALLATVPAAPVPEAATWAMMIAGFGMAGGAMRRRAKATARFA